MFYENIKDTKTTNLKIWKEHMEKIINEENEWVRMVETDLVEGAVEKMARNKIVEAMQKNEMREGN